MFLGHFDRSIDGKGRLTIPAKYRPGLNEGLVITFGLDRCLAIYPLAKWAELSARVNSLPMTDGSARRFRRHVFGAAHDDAPDDQGRIHIPPRLREYARLDGGAVVTGLGDHLEVWDPELWSQDLGRIDVDEVNPEAWSNLGI
jgi:MraZ protein